MLPATSCSSSFLEEANPKQKIITEGTLPSKLENSLFWMHGDTLTLRSFLWDPTSMGPAQKSCKVRNQHMPFGFCINSRNEHYLEEKEKFILIIFVFCFQISVAHSLAHMAIKWDL